MTDQGSELVEELMRFRPEGLTANAWAVKAGVSRTIWTDLKRHGNPSRRTLERLLGAAGSSLAEFEALRIGPKHPVHSHVGDIVGESTGQFRRALLPPIPVIASHAAPDGEWGASMRIEQNKVIDRLPRPSSLAGDRDAYAVTMVGESMWPRFRPGRPIAVSPETSAGRGDDVLVMLRPGFEPGRLVVIGELVRQTNDAIELRQFTPDRKVKVPAATVAAVHKILGELI